MTKSTPSAPQSASATSPDGVNGDWDDTGSTLTAGRVAPPWAPMPHWVMLSGISPTATCLYGLIRAHVNQARGDHMAWPGKPTLATMLQLCRADKVTPYLRELEDIGAIEVQQRGMPRRNHYLVHELPPDDHDGPVGLADWYAEHSAEVGAAKRAARERAAQARGRARTSVKPQVSPVATPEGLLPSPADLVKPQVSPVATPEGLEQEEDKNQELKAASNHAIRWNEDPKPKDQKPKDQNQNRAEDAAAAALVTEHLGIDADPDILIQYLRWGRNAVSVCGYIRHLAATCSTGVESMYEQAEEWVEDLSFARENAENLVNSASTPLDPDKSTQIIDGYVSALAIGCSPDVLDAALDRVLAGGLAEDCVSDLVNATNIRLRERSAARQVYAAQWRNRR